MIQDAWRHSLASNSISEQLLFTHDPLYAISGERPQSSSDYYTTAANLIRDLSDTQEVGIKLGAAILTDSAHSTFPLQQSLFSPKSLVASALHRWAAHDQDAGDITLTLQKKPSPGQSVVSMGEQSEGRSTEEVQGDVKLLRRMRKCGVCRVCRERNVRVSLNI